MNFEVEKLDMFKVKYELSLYTQQNEDDYNNKYLSTSSSDDKEVDSSESGDEEVDSSKSDDENWDATLDSYEKYVNDYISLMKKAKNGDMDALSEYPSILENAQKLSEKLQNAKGSMSSSQLSRYVKITNKMTQAAANK